MTRLATFVLAVLLFAVSSFAEQPGVEPPAAIRKQKITRLLTSRDATEQAWGAYLAANSQQRSAIPKIIPLLKSNEYYVAFAAIDALIRLHADVPEQDLIDFAKSNRPTPAIVFAASNPRKHLGLLMRLLDTTNGQDWVGVNRVLQTISPPAYAVWLWREWHPAFEVQVWDPPQVIGDLFCFRYEGPQPDQRPGFPPTYEYLIDGLQKPYDMILAPGAPPATYFRQRVGVHTPFCPVDRQEREGAYLKLLAGIAPRSKEGRVQPKTRVMWVDAEEYQADVTELRNEVRALVDAIRKGLLDRGLLTEDESATAPRSSFKPTDLRWDRKEPIPNFDWDY